MVLAINEAFTTVIMVTDANGDPATGLTINYRVFDEAYNLFASGSMSEIGSYGIYYKAWTPDAAGYWIFEAYYSGAFKFYDVKVYQVGNGIEDDLEDRLVYSPTADSILFRSGGTACPASKSIWNALGDGTISLNTLNTNLGSAVGHTLTSIVAKFGNTAETLAVILEAFVANESGGLGDRIAFLQQHIGKGTGTALPANKSLYDVIVLDRDETRTNGTLTADGTEQTVWTVDAPTEIIKPDKLFIDCTNMAAGDIIVVKVYYRIKTAGSYILLHSYTFSDAQDPDLKEIPLTFTRYGIKVTLTQSVGTYRGFDWEVFYGVG